MAHFFLGGGGGFGGQNLPKYRLIWLKFWPEVVLKEKKKFEEIFTETGDTQRLHF